MRSAAILCTEFEFSTVFTIQYNPFFFQPANAKITTDKPAALVSRFKRTVARDDRLQLPTNSALKQRIRRARKKLGRNYCFDNIDFDLPEELTTVDDENTVVADFKFNRGRLTIFSTTSLLKTLGKSKFCMIDGTFGIVPTYMRQLIVIHAGLDIDGEVRFLPVAYVLASDKEKRTYKKMYELIKTKILSFGINWKPEIVFSDMEMGLLKATLESFNNVDLHTCFFHLAQAVLR